VLRLLADGPTYGYAIATRLEEAGLGSVKGGTLYPLLSRFEASGLVTVDWQPGTTGPGRKYFALTPAGHAELRSQCELWAEFADLTKSLVAVAPAI
jgi:PadR family transcriptional regulator PadR